MSRDLNILVHFKDIAVEEEVREHVVERCTHLAEEFPEAMQFEVTLEPGAKSYDCHVHVSGKRTRAAAHATGVDSLRRAGDTALDKLERELRKEHDKRIFAQRRRAQKARGKRVD